MAVNLDVPWAVNLVQLKVDGWVYSSVGHLVSQLAVYLDEHWAVNSVESKVDSWV